MVVVVVFCIVVVVVLSILFFFCDGDGEMVVVTTNADLSILSLLTSLFRALTTCLVHRSRYLSTLDFIRTVK